MRPSPRTPLPRGLHRPLRRPRAWVLLLAAWLAAPALAMDEAAMQALMDEFGKEPLLQVIMDRRGGQVTVRSGGGTKKAWGRPRLDLVDAGTLAQDAAKSSLTVDDLRAALGSHAKESEARERRLTGSDGFQNAAEPLANIDPGFRVRPSRGRSWTVEQLIKDAAREKRRWPDELNRLRQREASIRNRKLEDILLGWESRYGTMEINEIDRLLRDQLRGQVQDCRTLRRSRKKADKEMYRLRDCKDVMRRSSRGYSRELREKLYEPFKAFEAAVRPAIRAHAERKSAGSLY